MRYEPYEERNFHDEAGDCSETRSADAVRRLKAFREHVRRKGPDAAHRKEADQRFGGTVAAGEDQRDQGPWADDEEQIQWQHDERDPSSCSHEPGMTPGRRGGSPCHGWECRDS